MPDPCPLVVWFAARQQLTHHTISDVPEIWELRWSPVSCPGKSAPLIAIKEPEVSIRTLSGFAASWRIRSCRRGREGAAWLPGIAWPMTAVPAWRGSCPVSSRVISREHWHVCSQQHTQQLLHPCLLQGLHRDLLVQLASMALWCGSWD